MKKVLIVSAIFLFAGVNSAFAQDDEGTAYYQGQNSVSIGYGFISPYKTLFKLQNGFGMSSTTAKFSSMGPIGITYENGIAEKISVGIQVAYSTMKNVQTDKGAGTSQDPNADYVVTQKLTQISAILRGNYHFGSSEKFDPYVGLGLGYGNFKYKTTSNDNADNQAYFDQYYNISVPTSFGFTGQIGAKYYFSSNIGVYAELGYLAGSFAQLGLTFKF